MVYKELWLEELTTDGQTKCKHSYVDVQKHIQFVKLRSSTPDQVTVFFTVTNVHVIFPFDQLVFISKILPTTVTDHYIIHESAA